MITNSKQNWSIGQKVKVGFLVLTVKSIDKMFVNLQWRDVYILTNGKNDYTFNPHHGLNKI